MNGVYKGTCLIREIKYTDWAEYDM